MTIDAWLKAACEDADRRGLPELKPLLETLARSMAALREAEATLRIIARPASTRQTLRTDTQLRGGTWRAPIGNFSRGT